MNSILKVSIARVELSCSMLAGQISYSSSKRPCFNLEGTNRSRLAKRKLIFKSTLIGDTVDGSEIPRLTTWYGDKTLQIMG